MRTKQEIIMQLGELIQELGRLDEVESAEMQQNRPLRPVYMDMHSPPKFVPDGPETIGIRVVFKEKL